MKPSNMYSLCSQMGWGGEERTRRGGGRGDLKHLYSSPPPVFALLHSIVRVRAEKDDQLFSNNHQLFERTALKC